MSSKGKVVVGMSGGVDSSVTAALLKDQGYEVIGVTMNVWQKENGDVCDTREKACCALSAVTDAQNVARKLGIDHFVLNFRDVFKRDVIDYFVDDYIHGKTPNPCIACNKYIKFGALMEKAKVLGADYVATGHYATIEYSEDTKRYSLKKSISDKKDQTYALYNLTQEQLAHVLLPLGIYEKETVRKMAEEYGLDVAKKPDSQEICFVENDDYVDFIKTNTDYKPIPGKFVDKNGKVLGRHNGVIYYTIGQRKGLGISFSVPKYVVDINTETNEVILGDNEDLFTDTLYAQKFNFIPFKNLEKPMNVTAKIRYSHKAAEAVISMKDENTVECKFKDPQRAITKGQSVVFYDGDVLVGGGVIV